MSLKRKDIIWLMENYGSMPVEPCGRGKEESNLTINGKPDHEVSMASKELDVTARYAQSLAAKMDMAGEANLPAWVQSKITKAADYISKVYHYLEDYLHSEEALVVHAGDAMMSEDAINEASEKDLLKKMLMKINPDRKDIGSVVDELDKAQVQKKIRTIEKQNPDIYNNIMKVNEEVEGEIARAKHEIEIDLKISKSDMEKLHDGETITLKDKTGSNLFTVKVSSA